jgi:hypothetical protein
MKTVRFFVFVLFGFLMMACPGPDHGPDVTYRIFIYYINDNGENLLDPATNAHYKKSEVRVNGNADGFSIDSARFNSTFPKGYTLSFIPSRGIDGRNAKDLIKLTPALTDTLLSRYSGESLISCTYNGVNVLPVKFVSPLFPAVIVK